MNSLTLMRWSLPDNTSLQFFQQMLLLKEQQNSLNTGAEGGMGLIHCASFGKTITYQNRLRPDTKYLHRNALLGSPNHSWYQWPRLFLH